MSDDERDEIEEVEEEEEELEEDSSDGEEDEIEEVEEEEEEPPKPAKKSKKADDKDTAKSKKGKGDGGSTKASSKPAAAADPAKKKKSSKSAKVRLFEDHFGKEAREIAAQLKTGRSAVKDASGKLTRPAIPPMPHLPDNDRLEEYKRIYEEKNIFTGEETQDTSRFIILHKESARAYERLIAATEDTEDGKPRDLAVQFEQEGSAEWRAELEEKGMLVTAAHHRIVLDKSTRAVYWLLDATRLPAAGQHFLNQLRGKNDLKNKCEARIKAARAEYEQLGHTLEEQDADGYDPENIKTHVFVQLNDIQKRTVYPEARSFLYGLSDAKTKLRTYEDITCYIPAHIIVPHLYGLMKNAERRKNASSGEKKAEKASADKGKRPARPKLSAQQVDAPVIRPSGAGSEGVVTATRDLLSLAKTGAVSLEKLESTKAEYVRKEAEAEARLAACTANMREALAIFSGRFSEDGKTADERIKLIEDLGSGKGAPGRYLERIFLHPDPEERKKRVNAALAGAAGCIREALKYTADSDDDDKYKDLCKSLNDQVQALEEVFSLSDTAAWRDKLKDAEGRDGPVTEFTKWLVPKGKCPLARKFFMAALLIGADSIDRVRAKQVDQLVGEVSKILTAYDEEATRYKGTIQEFAEQCANTAHAIQSASRAEKEARENENKDLARKLEEATEERDELAKRLAAREREIDALKAKATTPSSSGSGSKPKGIPPDCDKHGEKHKDSTTTSGGGAEKKAKVSEERKGEDKERKGEKRKEEHNKGPATTKDKTETPKRPKIVEEKKEDDDAAF